MEIPSQIADQIYAALIKAKKVLIMSHQNPDPDTLGSNLTLKYILEKYGKEVSSACLDPIPENYHFLPELKTFVTEFDPKNYDLFISVDSGSIKQAAFPEKYPGIKQTLINIDHHPSNDNFGTINLVIDNAASTTIILYYLLNYWKEEITPYIATLLLYGLYYDTGSFMHSNTDHAVYEVAAKLLEKGANKNQIIKNLFKNHTTNKLKLWGKALSSTTITNNKVVVAGVTEEEFQDSNTGAHDLSGLIDYLNTIKGTQYATLISSDNKGNIKGSLRTRRDDVNVSEIAQNLGGGGHKKASGFSIKGKIKKETHWSIVNDKGRNKASSAHKANTWQPQIAPRSSKN